MTGSKGRFIRGWLPILAIALACRNAIRADQGWEGHSLQLNWENDATRSSDRHYTQGARIRYRSSDTATPGWLLKTSHAIPAWGFEISATKFGFEVGQEIYTPENLDESQPLLDDQPYAGWLYGAMMLQRRGPGPAAIPVLEELRLDLGVIGPESQAEHTQKAWHGRDPSGWHHQLETECGFALRYERAYLLRARSQSQWAADLIPQLDASAGNVDIHFGMGAMTRLGYNIPNHFEAPGKKTEKKFGAYLFGGCGGRVVLRNMFLDGNTWYSSHSVDKHGMVGDASVGITLVLKAVELTASHRYRTREFEGQDRADSYGSATLSFKF